MVHLTFSISKFVDALRRYDEQHKSDEQIFPKQE
jgi:hypothetical protein